MLRIVFRNRHRNLPKAEGLGSGPQGRINRMRKLVTALYRYERIEGAHHYLDESRGYAERVSFLLYFFILVYTFLINLIIIKSSLFHNYCKNMR